MPFAAACLDDGSWPLSSAEVYDNYRSALHVLGDHLVPGEEEKEGFFTAPRTEAEWSARLEEKFDEFADDLSWRGASHLSSRAAAYRRPAAYTAAAPPDAEDSAPCGLSGRGPRRAHERRTRRSLRQPSTARQLSPSGCVWLLEHACIDERRIILFADGELARELPRRLLGCGEFGNYDFSAVEVLPTRSRLRYSPNVSEAETLLVIPGMMGGVSVQNPFHLLHSTVPVAWQLHHPSYGLCVPREELDVRFACMSGFHGRRQAHFWKIFSTSSRKDAKNIEQQFGMAAMWRFWWGPLVDSPPLPLGADPEPRCYSRVVFGRELLRTGIGGFVTPRVFAFYRRYVAETIAAAAASEPSPAWRRAVEAEAVAAARLGATSAAVSPEWLTYRQMRPGAERPGGGVDALSLGDLGRRFSAALYSDGGAERLRDMPFRPWRACVDNPALCEVVPEEDGDRVRTELVLSKAAPEAAAQRAVHVLLVQRPRRQGRWIANLPELTRWVERLRHPGARIALLVADFEQLHPAAQWQLAAQAHILIGVTGAALAWTAFLPRGGVVLDVFPPGSRFCTEGWGRNAASHFGGLARLGGQQHTCTQHPAATLGPPQDGENEVQHAAREVRQLLGGFWHGQSVRVDMGKFAGVFREAVDRVLTAVFNDAAPR